MSTDIHLDAPAPTHPRVAGQNPVRAALAFIVVTTLTFLCVGSIVGVAVMVVLRQMTASPTVMTTAVAIVGLAVLAASAKYGSLAWHDERYPTVK